MYNKKAILNLEKDTELLFLINQTLWNICTVKCRMYLLYSSFICFSGFYSGFSGSVRSAVHFCSGFCFRSDFCF